MLVLENYEGGPHAQTTCPIASLGIFDTSDVGVYTRKIPANDPTNQGIFSV